MGSEQQFIKSYLDAWNDHDAAGVAQHFCEDGLYCDVPAQQELGGEDLVSYLVEYFSNDQYEYRLVGDVLVNAGTVAFQYRVHHPTAGSAEQPFWEGAEFIRLADGAAEHINDYYRLPGDSKKRGNIGDPGRRYAKSGLGDEQMQGLLAALDVAMSRDKIYLDPELSLPRLAESLGCSVNHLSQAINAGHSMSFFDYINKYRVEEAARLLRNKDCQFPAILDVALSVGFNSTSTFYTAFKKATGQTPAKYRRCAA
ncbi:MAG: hypothetical protein Cons2KO_06310 [Congregibacter sp.]